MELDSKTSDKMCWDNVEDEVKHVVCCERIHRYRTCGEGRERFCALVVHMTWMTFNP